MQISLVPIGNSRGIVLSQSLIKQCGFKNTIEVEVIDNCLILKAPKHPRGEWEKMFKLGKNMTDLENREMLAFQNKWDEEDWVW